MSEHDERERAEREAAEARDEAESAEREADVDRAEAEVEEAEATVEELADGGRSRERDVFENVADRIAAAEDRLRSARERLESAREAYHAARHEHRAERHAERERERGSRRAERDVERDARREERRARHEERRRMRATFGFASRGFTFDLGDLIDGGPGGEEFTDRVEGRFTVSDMPTVRVRNVSGETRISAGAPGEVRVNATKRVRGSSAEKAKRLLQNIDVRMEQRRDEITVSPHLFDQERGWLDLFRGGRVSVDLEIVVPREARIEAHTVSGELRIAGTRGPVEAQSVSGDVQLEDLQGPLWLKTVSGDATCSSYVGFAEVNSTSGDVTFESARLRDLDVVTVSGDVDVDGELAPGREHRVKTISGDVTLALGRGGYEISYKTMSGDVDASADANVTREGRKDRRVVLGAPGDEVRVHVKTVSGDLSVRRSSAEVPHEDEAAAETSARAGAPRTPPPAPPEPPAPPRSDVRDVLDRLSRGELDVDAAAAAIDEAKGGR
ncbi:MAG TPA: DUF4097 family beta strand repeat-containing protein [Candidatus Limnocylindria bacterium]|nr:DUF4097 family beta strand repeat-containing protein [Candidatus Limnocylindria bacterium]